MAYMTEAESTAVHDQTVNHALACHESPALQVVEGTAKLHGCTADVKWSDQAYIPTVNDPKVVSMVEEAAGKLVGVDRWQRMAEPSMAAEDFGFLAGRTKSSLMPQGSL